MKDIGVLKKEAQKDIIRASSISELDGVFRVYLGRKGSISELLKKIKDLPAKDRKKNGAQLNILKRELEDLVARKRKDFTEKIDIQDDEWIDVTAPGVKLPQGHLHPLTKVLWEIEEIFISLGFSVSVGSEVEDEWYNFDALNIPAHHPARDLWDTFWLKDKKKLLRTHTSPAQIHYMQETKPPFRIVVPGKVFRHEATDATHGFQFYQVEGLLVAEDANIAQFRAIIQEFFSKLFKRDVEIRLRPSYFPFVEPGFEVDMRYKGSKWLEMMGAGMVHPKVFESAGYIPGKWRGIAFGIGLDRIAMMKYSIDDARLFHSGDIRFLEQF